MTERLAACVFEPVLPRFQVISGCGEGGGFGRFLSRLKKAEEDGMAGAKKRSKGGHLEKTGEVIYDLLRKNPQKCHKMSVAF